MTSLYAVLGKVLQEEDKEDERSQKRLKDQRPKHGLVAVKKVRDSFAMASGGIRDTGPHAGAVRAAGREGLGASHPPRGTDVAHGGSLWSTFRPQVKQPWKDWPCSEHFNSGQRSCKVGQSW